MEEHHGSVAALGRLLHEVELLLKEPRIGMELGRQGINMSIALVAVQGVAAYLRGDSRAASDDLMTAAEELRSRLERR